jgi:hypothetical protein
LGGRKTEEVNESRLIGPPHPRTSQCISPLASDLLGFYLKYHATTADELAKAALIEFWSCHEAQRLAALAQAFPEFAVVRTLLSAETKLINGYRMTLEVTDHDLRLAGVGEELRAHLKCLRSLITRIAEVANEAGAARGLQSFFDRPIP